MGMLRRMLIQHDNNRERVTYDGSITIHMNVDFSSMVIHVEWRVSS